MRGEGEGPAKTVDGAEDGTGECDEDVDNSLLSVINANRVVEGYTEWPRFGGSSRDRIEFYHFGVVVDHGTETVADKRREPS